MDAELDIDESITTNKLVKTTTDIGALESSYTTEIHVLFFFPFFFFFGRGGGREFMITALGRIFVLSKQLYI